MKFPVKAKVISTDTYDNLIGEIITLTGSADPEGGFDYRVEIPEHLGIEPFIAGGVFCCRKDQIEILEESI